MSQDLLEELLETSRGRMLGDGVETLDLDEILARCKSFDDWYEVVADVGDRYENMAKEYLSKGGDISAGEMFWRASMYYHCLLYTSPSPRDYAASRMPSSA